jgi:hypothetical protein
MKTCSRCGETKPVENFRNYYDKPGKYRHCKECERIESRRKYLVRRGDAITAEQQEELDSINKLYESRFNAGLSAPGYARQPHRSKVSDMVNEQLAKYK